MQIFQEPRGYFKLESTCKVTAVRVDNSKKKSLYVFRIVWPMGAEEGDNSGLGNRYGKPQSQADKKERVQERPGAAGAASSGKMAVTVGGAMVRPRSDRYICIHMN